MHIQSRVKSKVSHLITIKSITMKSITMKSITVILSPQLDVDNGGVFRGCRVVAEGDSKLAIPDPVTRCPEK